MEECGRQQLRVNEVWIRWLRWARQTITRDQVYLPINWTCTVQLPINYYMFASIWNPLTALGEEEQRSKWQNKVLVNDGERTHSWKLVCVTMLTVRNDILHSWTGRRLYTELGCGLPIIVRRNWTGALHGHLTTVVDLTYHVLWSACKNRVW